MNSKIKQFMEITISYARKKENILADMQSWGWFPVQETWDELVNDGLVTRNDNGLWELNNTKKAKLDSKLKKLSATITSLLAATPFKPEKGKKPDSEGKYWYTNSWGIHYWMKKGMYMDDAMREQKMGEKIARRKELAKKWKDRKESKKTETEKPKAKPKTKPKAKPKKKPKKEIKKFDKAGFDVTGKQTVKATPSAKNNSNYERAKTAWNSYATELKRNVKELNLVYKPSSRTAGQYSNEKKYIMLNMGTPHIEGTLEHELQHSLWILHPYDKQKEFHEKTKNLPVSRYAAEYYVGSTRWRKIQANGRSISESVKNIIDGNSPMFIMEKVNKTMGFTDADYTNGKVEKWVKGYVEQQKVITGNENHSEFMRIHHINKDEQKNNENYKKVLEIYKEVFGPEQLRAAIQRLKLALDTFKSRQGT